MTRVDEFRTFYRAKAPDILRVTYALCGDRNLALDATVEAFRRTWRDWQKLRNRDPLPHTRDEAWKSLLLMRGAHPLRRRHEDDGDTDLLDALHELDADQRRLIVLLTIGDTDLEQACREIEIDVEEGTRLVTPALDRLETELGVPIDQLEPRLRALGEITRQLTLPSVAQVRRSADRGRLIATAAAVAVALIASLGAGLATVDRSAMLTRADAPQRQLIGAERPDVQLESRKITVDALLTAAELGPLDEASMWTISGTENDTTNTEPYATCQTRRFANADPVRVFVRTFAGTGDGDPVAAQAIEVSRNAAAAREAYKTTVQWYANCTVPNLQLQSSFLVKRTFGDFRILRLRVNGEVPRIITVGFAQSGRVTTTLVHETDGTNSPEITSFAELLNSSVERFCDASGGRCSSVLEVEQVPPPATEQSPEFLSVVDLPMVPGVNAVWVGVDPSPTPRGRNPASTLCDTRAFDARGVPSAMSRIFVTPDARGLPQEFGVAETVTTFDSDEAAARFIDGVRRSIESCTADKPNVDKLNDDALASGDIVGRAWRLRFIRDDDSTIDYRMALVRNGASVAQLSFVPFRSADLGGARFGRVAIRAGERLTYATAPTS